MKRSHMILGGLLLVQVVLLLAVRSPFSGEAAAAVRPLLPELASLTASRVRIQANDGQNVELERRDGQWVLPEAGAYPAEEDKVGQLLGDLQGLKVRRPVVTSPRYHANLKVTDDEHERRVQIWDGDKEDPAVDLLVGTSPNYRISNVRRAGEDEVYEVMGLSPWDLRTDRASWIERKVVDVPFPQVTGLRLTNDHGSWELRKRDDQWTVAPAGGAGTDEVIDQEKVDSLVRSFTAVYMAEPAGKLDPAAQGLAEPAAVVEIIQGGQPVSPDVEEAAGAGQDAGGETGESTAVADGEGGEAATPPVRVTTLKIGGEVPDGEGKRYASRDGFDYAIILNKVDAERALDKKLSDLRPD